MVFVLYADWQVSGKVGPESSVSVVLKRCVIQVYSSIVKNQSFPHLICSLTVWIYLFNSYSSIYVRSVPPLFTAPFACTELNFSQPSNTKFLVWLQRKELSSFGEFLWQAGSTYSRDDTSTSFWFLYLSFCLYVTLYVCLYYWRRTQQTQLPSITNEKLHCANTMSSIYTLYYCQDQQWERIPMCRRTILKQTWTFCKKC